MLKIVGYGKYNAKETGCKQSRFKCVCTNCGHVFETNYIPIRNNLAPVYIRCPKCFNNVSVF